MGKRKRRFLKARFFLTNNCPYNCLYCHNEGMGSQEASREQMTVDDYVYLATVLKDHFHLKCITLTGGDPFLFDSFSSLVRQLKRLNIELVALTKGIPVMTWLRKEPSIFDYLDFVYFSIDTLDRNDFSRTCRISRSALAVGINALDQLVAKGVKVRVNCVVMPDDVRETKKMLQMIDFARKHRIQQLRFIELFDVNKVRRPFVEELLLKTGLSMQPSPEMHFDMASQRKKFTLSDGFEFLVLRCMCSVTLFTGKVSCFNQDLFVDSLGRVNTCLEWEVQNNPYGSRLFKLIRNRETEALSQKLEHVKNGLHVCPVLVTRKRRAILHAGLQLGTYR